MVFTLLALVLGVMIVILAGLLLYYSTGKPAQFLDKNGKPLEGSLSEKTFVTIGGIRQGMFIRSKNIKNPVLLYLHGGPAFPNYFLAEKYNPGLEESFTVCYWEQRGGGLSYSPEVPLESMTFEQLTADAIEVSHYLRKRFGKEKIYLMAHSGGTPIAIQAVVKAPEIYHAYLAMAQITNQAESEKMAYKYIKEQYTALGKTKELKELNRYPVLESDSHIIPFYQSMIRDKSMHELGIGTMRAMTSVFWGVFIPVWMCKAYSIREKINIWKSKFTFIKKARFVEQLFAYDIPSMFPELEVPIYFFSGKYDLTVNIGLSKAYFKKLKAPLKRFYTFEHSAHSPLFEEPHRMRDIIAKDVLNHKAELADFLINKQMH